MTDFLLSPEGAKEISLIVFALMALAYLLRFGLSFETRTDIMRWVRRHIHIAN
jgi:hypothetical protein